MLSNKLTIFVLVCIFTLFTIPTHADTAKPLTYLYSLATDYFAKPYNLCIKDDGTLFVIDQGTFLKRFNQDVLDLSWSPSKELIEKLKNTRFSAITTDDEYLYITLKDREIIIVDMEGKIVKSLFYEDLSWFCSITYDKFTNSLILTDNSQILRLHRDGSILESNIYAELWQPLGVKTNSKGDIIIADTNNHLIKIYNTDLELQATRGGLDPDLNLIPFSMAIDEYDRIYVSNSESPEIWIFNPEGQLLFKYIADPKKPEDFISPGGIDIHGDYLYVADTFNNRVQKFKINHQLLNELEKALDI